MKNQLQKSLISSEGKKTRLENPRKLQALYLSPLCSRLQQHWKITPCGMQEPTVMSLGDYLAFMNFCIPNLVMLSIGTYGSANLSSSQRWAGSGLWQIWVPVVYIFSQFYVQWESHWKVGIGHWGAREGSSVDKVLDTQESKFWVPEHAIKTLEWLHVAPVSSEKFCLINQGVKWWRKPPDM